MDSEEAMDKSGMTRLKFSAHLSAEGCKRFFDEFLPVLHKAKYDVLKEDDDNSWYLVYIGTKPESRGKGLAGKLIAHTTKEVRVKSKPKRTTALLLVHKSDD